MTAEAEPVPIRLTPEASEGYSDVVPGLPVGSWVGRLIGWALAEATDDESGERIPKHAWTWLVDVDGREIVFERRTGRRLTKNSAYLQIAVAILGPAAVTPAAQIAPSSLLGGEAVLTVEVDPQYGYVVSYSAVPKRSRRG